MTQHAPLMIDVAGLRLSAADRQRLKHPLVGGVTLFGRNWQDRAQLLALCRAIKKVRSDLLIAVDHEGGRVQRFKTDGFTHLPAMRSFGQLWLTGGPLVATRAATACGYVLGAELRACGVDLTFAPVLDLDYGASSVIGDRSLGRDPRMVAVLAQSLLLGLSQAGMASCGKHFPGHGFVKADSHTDVPKDPRSLKAILADDALPFEALSLALGAVMPAHVVYSKVDARPAGFSSHWLGDILRGQFKFGGAIFSDDLGMAAARRLEGRHISLTDAALSALCAGCDLALVCNLSLPGMTAIDEVLDGLAEAQLTGTWQPSEASEERRRALLPKQLAMSWDELMTQPHYMLALDCVP